MNTVIHSNKKIAVAVFFATAIVIRYYFAIYKPTFLSPVSDGLLYAVLTGIGPFIGGVIAVYLLGRKKIYSSFGRSIAKSLICLACPVLLFCLLDVLNGNSSFIYTKITITCLLYAYLEEYGWRGYLQSELINLRKWYRISIITILWFVWHLNFELSTGNFIFLVILFFGTWGIGEIVIKSHSVIACACFHSVINIMQNVDMNIAVLAVLVFCIILWFWLWYGKCWANLR